MEIVTERSEVKGASVMMTQRVMRGEDLLLDAQVQVAFVSGGRARPIPKPLRASPCRPTRTRPAKTRPARQGHYDLTPAGMVDDSAGVM